jgi:hypothetical protein
MIALMVRPQRLRQLSFETGRGNSKGQLVTSATGDQDEFTPPTPKYRVEANVAYRGNPLIEALPPVPTKEEAYLALALQPAMREAEFRSKDASSLIDLLGELQQVFVPTKMHIYALQKIIALVRTCYAYRDPNRPEVQRALYSAARGRPSLIGRLSPTGGGSNGMVLWGVTGSGKTSFIDRLVEYLGSLPIYHRLIQGGHCLWPQVPVLRIQCRKTLRGTSLALLEHLDKQLNSCHYGRVTDRLSRDLFLAKVMQAISINFVGLLVIEDVHKLKDQAEVVLDYLCDIMEECGVPVLVVSTYKFRKALMADEAIASKLTARGMIDFEPIPFSSALRSSPKPAPTPTQVGITSPDSTFDASQPEEDDDDWVAFVEELFQLNLFRKAVEMPDDLPKWLHFHAAGVRRFAREMLSVAFERSIRDESITNITSSLLDDIAANELQKYQDAVCVLRRRLVGAQISDADSAKFEHLLAPTDGLKNLRDEIRIRDLAQATSARTKGSTADSPAAPDKVAKKPSAKPATKKARQTNAPSESLSAEAVYARLRADGKIDGASDSAT